MNHFLLESIDDPFVSSFDLRNELLLASPRVTDRVLIEAIERDPAMNPWHVAQVLLANSPLPRNVLTALYRSDFDVYYKELVEDGQNGGISNTMIMESELSYFDGMKESARTDFVRQAFRQDSTLALNDSIIHYLSEDADDEQLKTLMAYHLKRGQYQQAEALLAQAPNMRWTNDYVDIISIVVDALKDTASADAVIAANETTLLAVANEHSSEAYLAQSLLETYGLAEYDEVIVMPGVQPRSMKVEKENTAVKRKALASVHPNPTKDTNADDVIANNTTQLLAIATDNSTEAFLAQSILEAYELAEFPDYIEMPVIGTTKLFKDKQNVKESIKPIASMHPNPTKDMIYLNWRLPEGMPPQSTNLIIYNGQGVQLLTRSITSEVGIEEFNTTDWPSGLYVYQLLHNNKPIHHGKFEVLR